MSEWRMVAAEAAASRIAVVCAAIAANLALPDHEAEGVRLWQQDYFEKHRLDPLL
jgi:hypothetical protein